MFPGSSVFVIVLLVVGCCCSKRPTPFIAWSNSDAFSSVRQREVSSVAGILEQAKLDKLDILLVFKTDSLSFDDIMKYSSAYGEGNSAVEALESQVSKAVSSVWSGVHDSPVSRLVETLSEDLGVQPNYLRGLTRLPQSSDFPQLLIFDLPAAGNKEEEFTQQDAVMAKVMASVEQLGRPYAAFYTAGGSDLHVDGKRAYGWIDNTQDLLQTDTKDEGNSLYPLDSEVPVRSRRQTPPTPGKVNVSRCWTKYDGANPCLLFCLPNINYTMRYIQDYDMYQRSLKRPEDGLNNTACLLNVTVDESTMICKNEKDSAFPELELTLLGVGEYCNATPPAGIDRIKLTFPHGNYTDVDVLPPLYWRMDMTAGDDLTLLRAHTDNSLYYRFAVPLGLSYGCSSATYNSYTVNATALAGFNGSVVQFFSLQVQPYRVLNISRDTNTPVFSSSYNCEGYFSRPSWMGIFVILVLLLILYLSTMFIFSMQTIDRFDDPRGQTINVENLH